MVGEATIWQLNWNWGSGFIFFQFSDTNLVNFAETFFLIPDKAMMWMPLLTFAAFFMPRYSAIHDWDTIVFFHRRPASNTLRGSVSSSADREQNTEVLLGPRHSSEANEDVGAPIPSARLVLAPPDEQISTINAPFDRY